MILVKMWESFIKKTNGELHRQCGVTIPKEISDHYPTGQKFFVERREDGTILYIPEENRL